MRFKKDVKIFGVREEIMLGMQVADKVWAELGVDLVITSVTDGRHSQTSLHYTGCAFDCRIWDIDSVDAARMLRDRLTDEFDVVVEKTHIHVEYQPQRG